ncbi:bifunctional diaminohydroxyphosphoribosylaminopyrimidine deaminase/5-amino-6-(5-phosphoribosylamino)uracil reductase RibD [Chlamydiota bacterium]
MYTFTDIDKHYMKRAFLLAKRGLGNASPNPMVGAVVVKGNKILSEGYHKQFGFPHAEENALSKINYMAKNATIYVTLEPCATTGKTKPCVDIIIKSGIKRVVIAIIDKNPLHSSNGINVLRKAGIAVEIGLLNDYAQEFYTYFFQYIQTKMPYTILKTAVTLDGKIATIQGQSKWITSLRSRRYVHQLRKKVDALLVSVNTVIKDDPLLTVRLKDRTIYPTVILVGSIEKLPISSRILQKESAKRVIIISKKTDLNDSKVYTLIKTGAQVITVNEKNSRIDLRDLLRKLGALGIISVLLESGGDLAFSFLKENLIHEIQYFYAPKLFGGKSAKTAVDGQGVSDIADAFNVKIAKIKKIDEDFLVVGKLDYTKK